MILELSNIRFLWIITFLHFTVVLNAQEIQYVRVTAEKGDGAIVLLNKYGLQAGVTDLELFRSINKLGKEIVLHDGKQYYLPISIFTYNGKSIRSTIGNSDWDQAVKIRDYNLEMHGKGLKKGDYTDDKVLWVPLEFLEEQVKPETVAISQSSAQVRYTIFGKDNEVVDIQSNRLEGQVYYVVAGHGGPDPGAMGKYNGHSLCEDEYAYDIALRLARCLIEQSATVYMIIRDDNDGIRGEAILKPDKDEVCWENQDIPLNQMARLKQRTQAINELYLKHKKNGNPVQRAIILHLDSRSSKQRIDMFFYHSPNSSSGKQLAMSMRDKIEEKYNEHQKNRGYSGTVEARNLYILRKTLPVAVFIELGNIRNSRDQKRFILEDNRQAVANWLCEGLLNASQR